MLITGASRGIGQETAIQYARAGAFIALVARTEESLKETTDSITSTAPGAEVLALAADVREAKAAEAAVQRVVERFGKLDVLIANAGSISVLGKRKEKGLDFPRPCKPIDLVFPSVLDEKDPDAWWNAFEVNVRGTFNFVWCDRTAAEVLSHPLRCSSDISLANSAAVRAIKETHGYVVALSSVGAQLRIPGSSDANISKHAVNRLVEFVALGQFISC